MNIELEKSLADDALLRALVVRLFELVEEPLHLLVVLFEEFDGVGAVRLGHTCLRSAEHLGI